MAADTTDYVLKVSGINFRNDGFQFASSVDLSTKSHTLSFDICAVSGSETLVLFIGKIMSSTDSPSYTFTFDESWQTVEYTFSTTGVADGYFDDFTFNLISWCTDDDHDYYIKNITLTERYSDFNLLTGSTEPLDFLDTSFTFSPISRDTSKESDCVLSYVNINDIVTVGNASGYVLYTEYTGVDADTWEYLNSEYFVLAAPGSVISKKQNVHGVHITKLFWCNSVLLDLERHCTYRITFELSGHVRQHHTGQIVLPNGFGAMSISDSLPEKHTDIGNLFNSENQLYSNLVEANYNQSVTMLDDVADDGKEDTFIYEYIFSTADGYIDNFDSGTYYVNFLNLDSDWLTEYDVRFVGVNVEAVVDPNSEYYEKLILEQLGKSAAELALIGAQASKRENWALDKAEDLRTDAKAGMSENLDIAKSFISGSTFGARAGSIQTAATAFGTIYNSVVSAVPAPLQALIIIIPTLAFIGWVIGRVQ